MIWNQTTVISVQATTVRERVDQITVDMDGIESRLRELEQQANEDEQLVTQVGRAPSSLYAGEGPRVRTAVTKFLELSLKNTVVIVPHAHTRFLDEMQFSLRRQRFFLPS